MNFCLWLPGTEKHQENLMHNLKLIRRRFPNRQGLVPLAAGLSLSAFLVGLGLLLLS
jgi:hypothetical protein